MLKASLGMLGFLVDDKTGRILAACAGESRHNAQRERSMIDLCLTDAVVPCITVVICRQCNQLGAVDHTAAADRQNFGLNVGVLGEWKLSNYFALRLIPSLYFGSKHLMFRNLATGKTESQDMKSSYIALPVDIKVSGPRFNNYRPYVVAGVNPLYDLTAGKHTKLRAKPFDVMLEAGLGCDLYLSFFKFIPELKFCFGLGNILQKRRTDLTDSTQLIYTQSVDRASLGMVVLSFYFE